MIVVGEGDKTSGMRAVSEKNKERVRNWFILNPGESIAKCSRALGLHWHTVRKHVISIQKGE